MPIFSLWSGVQMVDINKTRNGNRNILYCPAISSFLFDKYIPIFSLRSGVQTVGINKTRDTNGMNIQTDSH